MSQQHIFLGLYSIIEYLFYVIIVFSILILCLCRICFYFNSNRSDSAIPSSPVRIDTEAFRRQRHLEVFNQRHQRNSYNIERVRNYSHQNIYNPPGVTLVPEQEANLQIPSAQLRRNSEPVDPLNFSQINENSHQNPEADLPPSYDALFPENKKP